MEEEGPESEELQFIYDRLEALDPAKLETRAGELLYPAFVLRLLFISCPSLGPFLLLFSHVWSRIF